MNRATLIEREICKRSFKTFIRRAWRYAEPAQPLVPNWHIDVTADHFQALVEGRITNHRLMVNFPPGHAKSIIASVLLPAWVWTWKPTHRSIYAAYSYDNTVRDSKRTRWVIESDWYQDTFVNGEWSLRRDSNAQDMFENTLSGFRLATSVGGNAPGKRGDMLIIDDPHKPGEVGSELKRRNVIEWFGGTMSSRFNRMEMAIIGLIMQRLHHEDLAGYLYAQGGWDRLCLQSIKQNVYPPTSLGWVDPRAPGELLFPAMFPQSVLDRAKRDIRAYGGFNGQHQQNPTNEEKQLFKIGHWRWWRPPGSRICLRPMGADATAVREIPLDSFETIIISVDAAFKGEKDSSFVVMQVWGVIGADRYLIDQIRRQMEFSETCLALAGLVIKYPRASAKLIEDKANGPAIISSLSSRIHGLIPIGVRGSKIARAQAVHPQVFSGNVFFPEHCLTTWLPDFLDELEQFPLGGTDDQVDALSQALDHLALANLDDLLALCGMRGQLQ